MTGSVLALSHALEDGLGQIELVGRIAGQFHGVSEMPLITLRQTSIQLTSSESAQLKVMSFSLASFSIRSKSWWVPWTALT